MSSLTVSVIIPTYNRAHLVCEAIDSCLAQTRVPDEIIVVDDGSTDETRAVLEKYHQPVIIVHQKNGGLSKARNTGIERSSGELVAFLDDDDTLTQDSIELRSRYLEAHPSIDVVYGDVLVSDAAKNIMKPYSEITATKAHSGNVFYQYAIRNVRPVHTFMIRRSCVLKTGLFDESLKVLEDYDFWLRASTHGNFYYMDVVLGVYRYHNNRMTSQQKQLMMETEVKVRAKAFSTKAFIALSPIQQARAYSVHGTQYFSLGETSSARHWYVKALRTAPLLWRPYALLVLTLLGKRGLERVAQIVKRIRGSA